MHSKFSISFTDHSVVIWIQTEVNNEKTYLSPEYDFDDFGNIIIPQSRWSNNRETLKFVARHIKTTLNKLIIYLENSFEDHKNDR